MTTARESDGSDHEAPEPAACRGDGKGRKAVARPIPVLFVLLVGTSLARALLTDTWGQAARWGVLMAVANAIGLLVAGGFARFGRAQV